jgi:hypothetical protein
VRPRAVGEEPNAAEQVAARDARGGEDDLGRCKVVDGEDPARVLDSLLARGVDLPARDGPELGLELAAEAAERCGRQDRLARAADADGEVVVGSTDRGRDRGCDVAVLDELDAGARLADVLDEVVVARAVEDDGGDVGRAPAESLGDRDDVLVDRAQEVDLPAGDGPDGHLPHVHVRQGRQRPRRPGCDQRHRSVTAAGDDGPAL